MKKAKKTALGPKTNIRPAGIHKDQKLTHKAEVLRKSVEREIDELWNRLEKGGLR